MSTSASAASCMHTFAFHGNRISFKQGASLMVNATEMARPFKKRPAKWLELPTTHQFIETLLAIRKSDRCSAVSTINGIGTWFHEDVALEFARWLSPEFAIWCNDCIKELLTKGMTSLDPTRYVPIERFEILKRIAHMESEMAKYWQESSQRYLDLYRKTVDNHCKMIDERLAAVQARVQRSTPTSPTWMTVAGYASLHDIPCSLSQAGGLGRKAKLLCSKRGITPDTIPDPRFGRVNTYPLDILKEVFDTKIG